MPKGVRKKRKMPTPGMEFNRSFKGSLYTLQVIEDGGKIKYKIGDQIYNSPTAAAQSLVKNEYAVNGWIFWNMKNY